MDTGHRTFREHVPGPRRRGPTPSGRLTLRGAGFLRQKRRVEYLAQLPDGWHDEGDPPPKRSLDLLAGLFGRTLNSRQQTR